MKRVVFMGSKPVGLQCLTYLHEHAAELGIAIVAVLTNARGAAIQAYCDTHGLQILDDLMAYEVIDDFDLLVSVQYHQILKQHHIDKAHELAVNLHMAPLPEYRGANQFSFAILNGDREFGTTIHKIDSGIDSGDIIAQRRFALPEGCFVDELVTLTEKHSYALFKETIAAIVNNDVSLVKQSDLHAEKREFHLKSEIETLKQIDLNWDAETIERHVRATHMPGFEPPYCLISGKKVYFQRAENA